MTQTKSLTYCMTKIILSDIIMDIPGYQDLRLFSWLICFISHQFSYPIAFLKFVRNDFKNKDEKQ